jgi:hypothetical protein
VRSAYANPEFRRQSSLITEVALGCPLFLAFPNMCLSAVRITVVVSYVARLYRTVVGPIVGLVFTCEFSIAAEVTELS